MNTAEKYAKRRGKQPKVPVIESITPYIYSYGVTYKNAQGEWRRMKKEKVCNKVIFYPINN